MGVDTCSNNLDIAHPPRLGEGKPMGYHDMGAAKHISRTGIGNQAAPFGPPPARTRVGSSGTRSQPMFKLAALGTG